MMENIYSIKDNKANYYHEPVILKNDIDAKRHLTGVIVNNPKAGIGLFKNDFEIIRIGKFNAETGEVKDLPNVIVLQGSDVHEEGTK